MKKSINFWRLSFDLILIILIGLPKLTFSQYWGERVLEQSFEQQDFFFTPNYLNPYGLGNFAKTTPGLIADPMLNLIVNPADFKTDSLKRNYLYLDFRSIHNVNENQYYVYPYYDYMADRASYFYPFYYPDSRKEMMPVFNGAFLFRPFHLIAKGLFLGVTYQAIMQDDDYYAVPQDIYRSQIGQDYAGNRTAEQGDIPIIDKYSGEDKMHQLGHFLNFYAGYDLGNKLQV